MKYSVGVDIEDISRFEKMAKAKDKETLSTIYTELERKYCFSKAKPSQHLAAKFAGKEAVIKALRAFGHTEYYSSVEIKNKKSGVPNVKLLNKKLGKKFDIAISLSHCKDKAIAFAVAVLKGKR